jgi:hypothetical protein
LLQSSRSEFSFSIFPLSIFAFAFICVQLRSSVVPLDPQQFPAANKLAPPLVKPQQPLRLLANSYAHTDTDPPNRPQASAQPQNTIATQIHTIEPPVNPKRFRQPSRPSRQIH